MVPRKLRSWLTKRASRSKNDEEKPKNDTEDDQDNNKKVIKLPKFVVEQVEDVPEVPLPDVEPIQLKKVDEKIEDKLSSMEVLRARTEMLLRRPPVSIVAKGTVQERLQRFEAKIKEAQTRPIMNKSILRDQFDSSKKERLFDKSAQIYSSSSSSARTTHLPHKEEFLIDDEYLDQPQLTLDSPEQEESCGKIISSTFQRSVVSKVRSSSSASEHSTAALASSSWRRQRASTRGWGSAGSGDESSSASESSWCACRDVFACNIGQDIIQIKTYLLKLRRILQEAETGDGVNGNAGITRDLNVNNLNELLELPQVEDLQRQIALLEQQNESKDLTIRQLQSRLDEANNSWKNSSAIRRRNAATQTHRNPRSSSCGVAQLSLSDERASIISSNSSTNSSDCRRLSSPSRAVKLRRSSTPLVPHRRRILRSSNDGKLTIAIDPIRKKGAKDNNNNNEELLRSQVF